MGRRTKLSWLFVSILAWSFPFYVLLIKPYVKPGLPPLPPVPDPAMVWRLNQGSYLVYEFPVPVKLNTNDRLVVEWKRVDDRLAVDWKVLKEGEKEQ